MNPTIIKIGLFKFVLVRLGGKRFWVAAPLLSAFSASMFASLSDGSGQHIYNFDGSSSMKSAMDYMLGIYKNYYGEFEDHQAVDFNVQAIGSSSGLQKVLAGETDFALVSHNVGEHRRGHAQDWKLNRIRTIPIASEAMVLLYRMDNDCGNLVIDSGNVKKLYSLFFGISPDGSKVPTKMGDLQDFRIHKCNNIPLQAFTKRGGPSSSGTAWSFTENPILRDVCDDAQCKAWYSKIRGEHTNPGSNIIHTQESNALSWGNLKNNIRDGSMIYFPSSFVFNNWREISGQGMRIAGYNRRGETIFLTPDNQWQQIVKKYDWYRDLNIVYSVDTIRKDEGKEDLLNFLTRQNSYLTDLNLIPSKRNLDPFVGDFEAYEKMQAINRYGDRTRNMVRWWQGNELQKLLK